MRARSSPTRTEDAIVPHRDCQQAFTKATEFDSGLSIGQAEVRRAWFERRGPGNQDGEPLSIQELAAIILIFLDEDNMMFKRVHRGPSR